MSSVPPPPPPPPPGSGDYPPPPGSGDYPPPPGSGNYPPPEFGPLPGGGERSSKAVVSLVLGVISLLCFGIFLGIPAVIIGVLARKEIAERGQSGSGMATAGIVTGAIGAGLQILFLVTGFYSNLL